MANACPLNFKQVDSNITRFSAFVVSTMVLLYLYTDNILILYFLVMDFSLKLFLNPGVSPINMVAEFLKSFFRVKDKMVDGGAKKLAGIFGFTFVMMLIISHFIGSWNISVVIAGIFLLCSLLDVVFSFCIACKIYFLIKKIYPNFMNNL